MTNVALALIMIMCDGPALLNTFKLKCLTVALRSLFQRHSGTYERIFQITSIALAIHATLPCSCDVNIVIYKITHIITDTFIVR